MLIKIIPEQVEERWDFYAPMIQESLPPTVARSDRGMINVLRSILTEELVVWGYFHEEELYGVTTTVVERDKIHGERRLLIYTVYGAMEIPQRFWEDGLETLRKYAEAQNCTKIIAYTNLNNVIRLFSRLGGNTEYTFLEMEV